MVREKSLQNDDVHKLPILPAVGFIGTGTITASMVTGLSHHRSSAPVITVSPRNRGTAETLAAQFENVVVAKSNQEVVENTDIVILAVPGAHASEVLASLYFREDHEVISVVSGFPLPALQSSIAPSAGACLAVPLPSVSKNNGPTAVYPPRHVALTLFERLGSVLPVANAAQFQAVCAVSGTIAAFYSLADTTARWLAQSGVPADAAARYVSAMLSGMFGGKLEETGSSFSALAQEHTTPGGVNEEFLRRLTASGAERTFTAGLAALNQRLSSSTFSKK